MQKKHWESVQDKFNPSKLSPHISFNIDVGCHFSWFFMIFWTIMLDFKDFFKNFSENIEKMNAGPQNWRFRYQITWYDEFPHVGQNIKKVEYKFS